MTAPERFKPRDDWTVEEILVNRRTGAKPESDEYREARRKALEAAGLESDDPPDPSLEEMTPEQHAARKYPANERNRDG